MEITRNFRKGSKGKNGMKEKKKYENKGKEEEKRGK